MGASCEEQKFKKSSFCSIVFSNSMQQQGTISWSDCDMWRKVDFTQQMATASSVVGPRRSYAALPLTKLALKMGHGHCLGACCWSDWLQLFESRWNHNTWEVYVANHEMHWYYNTCSQHGSTKWTQFFYATPKHTSHHQWFKNWTNSVLSYPAYSPDLSPTNYHFFKH